MEICIHTVFFFIEECVDDFILLTGGRGTGEAAASLNFKDLLKGIFLIILKG